MNTKRIEELRAEITALREQRLAIIQTGQSLSISGSHSVTNVKLEEIDRAIRIAARELIALSRRASGVIIEVPKYGRR